MDVRNRTRWLAALLTVAVLGSWSSAAEPRTATIAVDDLHCMHCAKTVATKLYKIPGVALVRADVEAKLLIVEAKPEQTPSPRALWEAVEKSGKHPTRLECPAGIFTTRPES
jgi:copper chaperone CopZ